MENEDLEKARQAFLKNKPDLVINCVPKETLDRFKALAEEEFKDNKTGFAHYGYALKYLMDIAFPHGLEVEERLNLLENEINELKGQPVEKHKTIHLGNGKNIEVKVN